MSSGAPRRASEVAWGYTLFFPKGCEYETACKDVAVMLKALDAYLSSLSGLGREGVDALRLVCDEIVANVLRHAAPLEDATVYVEARPEKDRVVLCIRDNGADFDPFAQPQPYVGDDLERRRVGGLGLHLVKQIFPKWNRRREDGWNISEIERRFGG